MLVSYTYNILIILDSIQGSD